LSAVTPIVIVPGLGGSGETHWQTHLQRSLPNVTRVPQDDWERPELTRWMEQLARTVEARPDAILVAHSLGCPLVAHLARRRPDLSIKGALLVAPADVDSAHHTPPQTRGFAPIPLGPLRFRSILVASTNDPYITIERARELATAWGADFVNAGAVGHINVEAGFGPWTKGVGMVNSLIAPADARSTNSRKRLGLTVGAR
jgi:predicted alpha/beta hydrolase family esterase